MTRKIILSISFLLSFLFISAQSNKELYKIDVQSINGKEITLDKYKGKVILIVNTASKCGLTPQYEGLEAIYQEYKDKDFVVLGFPCNQFMGQEPGTADEIEKFCTTKYNITFPLFEKIEVNGDNMHTLYAYLKAKLPLEGNKNDIRWNFEKFLINKII